MMSISGDPRALGNFASYAKHSFPSHPSSSSSSSSSKIQFRGILYGESKSLEISSKLSQSAPGFHPLHCKRHVCFSTMRNKIASTNISSDEEGFLLSAVNMSFFERLGLAWKILFPSATTKRNSNASIAKQRLKMILFSDRCEVSDEAKQKIVRNIVTALSDFVEIDSQDKVQLSVSTDTDLGTIYSITVPVRRVKPEYQEHDEEYRGITNITYNDVGEKPGVVDVRFEFYQPNQQ